MLKRKAVGSRGRDSDRFSDGERVKPITKESASKELNETIETIKKYADNGNLPQIYDPLKSCFEVLKPFHLTDLEMGVDLPRFCKEFNKKSDEDGKGDSDESKNQFLFIPPLNLKRKQGSDLTESDFEAHMENQKSPSGSKRKNRSEKSSGNAENLTDNSFEYRFFSSDEKSQSSEEESKSGDSRRSKKRSDRSAKTVKTVSSRGLESPKLNSSKSNSSGNECEDEMETGSQANSLTDSQVQMELKSADQKARRTVEMIDQIREAIGAFQKKDTMTDEENKELKRNQRKLSKNLQQFEKITARVRHLVGLADKNFKKKWDDLENTIDDIQGGGDASSPTDKEEKVPCAVLAPTEVPPSPVKAPENKQQELEIETPRTRLKNDLKKLADEITADFDDSELETDENESQDLSMRAKETADEESVKGQESPRKEKKVQIMEEALKEEMIQPTEELEKKISKILSSEKSLSGVASIPGLELASSLPGFKTPSLPSVDSDAKSVPEVMLSLTGRLSESYSMQEKLAAENADLEGVRYQLQEELITKENAVEHLQRKVATLQAEMRLIVRENAQLNEKLISQGMNPGFEDKVSVKVSPPTQDDIIDMKLAEYRETTQTLEQTVGSLELEVKRLQQELSAVQKERVDLENQRKMMKININVQRRGMGTHGGLLSPLPPRDSNTELQVRELKEQYSSLQQDFNNKLLEVASLRAQNDKLMEITDKAREEKDYCQEQCKSLEKRLKQLEGEKTKMLGSKEQLFEQEQQMNVIKLRYREAQDEIDELKNQLEDHTSQLEDYRNKYLQAQQQVEEQIRQIDHMELEHQRAREEQLAEIQRIKQCFQEKLSELTPLPDILKETQLKVQEAQQLRMIAERNLEDLQRELQDSKERSNTLLRRIESERSTQQLGLDERSQMANRLECWEKKCNELRDENAKLKTTVARLEEASAQNEKRLDEKLHEVAQFANQLETLREESARQIARCKDRNETVKRSLQNQIADLERQLAQARATARTAQKDKDEIRQRMQTQINNLNDNFEQAQLRIKTLQSHVNFLKNSYSGMFTPEPSNMSLVDSASGFLMEPPCNPCDCSY